MASILVIDNDRQTRNLIRDILEPMGHEVREAGDGEEGLVQYVTRPSDLVLTDILMPKRDGISFLQKLIEEFPLAKVIVMSGEAKFVNSCNILHIAKRLGAKECLEKPFDIQTLRDLVDQVLSDKLEKEP